MSRVLLVLRHAESAWNAENRWQGWFDPPLSKTGERQVEAAALRLAGERFDAVVASDLNRARRTAELLAGALDVPAPVSTDARLREYDVGEWAGLRREEISARWHDLLLRWERGERFATPGGEDRSAFFERVSTAAGDLVRQAADGQRVLVVTHGGVVRALAVLAGTVGESAERQVGHLSGFWSAAEAGVAPERWVDLLEDWRPA